MSTYAPTRPLVRRHNATNMQPVGWLLFTLLLGVAAFITVLWLAAASSMPDPQQPGQPAQGGTYGQAERLAFGE